MIKKYLYYIIPVLVLVLTWIIILLRDGIYGEGRNEFFFAIADTCKVHQILITGDDTVNLKRLRDEWILNDSLSPSKVAVDNFLFAFSRLRIKGFFEDDMNEKGQDTINIQINVGGRIRNFLLFIFNGQDILQKAGSDGMFQVEVSGFSDIRMNQVLVPDPYFWRERLLFSLKSEEISTVKIQYLSQPEKSIAIINAGNNYLLQNLEGNYFYPGNILNQEKLQMFTSYFMDVFFNDFIKDRQLTDSILGVYPELKCIIETNSEDSIQIALWPVADRGNENQNTFYIRRNDENEIMTLSSLLVDLWRKDAGDFIY